VKRSTSTERIKMAYCQIAKHLKRGNIFLKLKLPESLNALRKEEKREAEKS